MKNPLIVIVIDGGQLQVVVSEQPGITFQVIDMDHKAEPPVVTYSSVADQVTDIQAYINQFDLDI